MPTGTYGNTGATSPEKQKFIANAAAQSYKGPSIVDYLSYAGHPNDSASIQSLAGQYGIGGTPKSAEYNTALLTALRSGASPMSSTGGAPAAPGAPAGTTPPAQTPAAPAAAPEDPYRTAFDTYLKSLEVSPEQKAAQDYLNSLVTGSKAANEKALETGETLGFATGEAQRVGRNNSLAIDAAARNLEAQTGYAGSKATIAKARADFEANIYKNKQDQNAPFELSPGQSRYTYNPTTGKYEVSAAADAKPNLPVSAEEYEYAKKNGYTGTYAQYQNEDANRKAKAAGSGSGSEYTNYDAKEKAARKASQQKVSGYLGKLVGGDGYVAPKDYKAARAAWVSDGYATKDFDEIFTIFVNPTHKSEYLK